MTALPQEVPGAESMLHINELELKAALNALMPFSAEAYGISVRLHMDNQTAVAYLNRCRGTRSRALCETTLAISRQCESRRIMLSGFYVPGKQNVLADGELYAEPSTRDWRLCNDAFSSVTGLWPVRIDLFAASWNAQLPVLAAWTPRPGAAVVNTFSIN